MAVTHDSQDKPVLVVDDEQSMREFLSIMLRKQQLPVEVADSGDEAIRQFTQPGHYRLVITDLKMPGEASGLDVLRHVKSVDPACQVVVMTAYATPETAISAIKEGAYDYITKPFKIDQARVVVERALEKYELVSENLYLKQALESRSGFSGIIGRSEPMRRVFEMINRVAPTKTTVLLTGESGTGKELVARAIHENGPLEGEFIPVNCGAIPENLIEAELFGYKKGAFTGASTDRKGLFEAANGGTIFLDEVGELPLNTQVRLLRVLQEKKVKPVGGMSEIAVDARVVAATNRNLREEVEAGRFREDLFYRLNVIPIELPPLRERGSDVKLLIEAFIEHYSKEIGNPVHGIDSEALRALMNYNYPGNVRELQNIIERAITLEMNELITTESLPPHLRDASFNEVAQSLELTDEGIDLDQLVEDLERTMLTRALEKTGGNRTEAAKMLGISFRSIRYRLKKYGMSDDD